MSINIHEVIEIIDNSDLVLVGCGTEISVNNQRTSISELMHEKCYSPLYHYNIFNKKDLELIISDESISDWIDQVLYLHYYKNINKEDNIYQKIYNLVKDKDYFVVTTNTDETIYQSDFVKSQIVAPCGNEGLFQCEKLCNEDVWMNQEYIQEIMNQIDRIMEDVHQSNTAKIHNYFPKCQKCNGLATLNIRKDATTYSERGYLNQWQAYMNWLQKTLNKKIVMLEFGENFSNPSVIRWPFEKNTFINNQALLIRINEKFPQTPEEIKEKSISIEMNSLEFLKNI